MLYCVYKVNNALRINRKEVKTMSEETKKAIEELVKATEGNDLAKAFLRGYKSGLDTAKADDGEKETRPA